MKKQEIRIWLRKEEKDEEESIRNLEKISKAIKTEHRKERRKEGWMNRGGKKERTYRKEGRNKWTKEGIREMCTRWKKGRTNRTQKGNILKKIG